MDVDKDKLFYKNRKGGLLDEFSENFCKWSNHGSSGD